MSRLYHYVTFFSLVVTTQARKLCLLPNACCKGRKQESSRLGMTDLFTRALLHQGCMCPTTETGQNGGPYGSDKDYPQAAGGSDRDGTGLYRYTTLTTLLL